eukprot:5199188-Ditylum_brightwellii.AAC.1
MVAGGSAARTLGPFAAVFLYYEVQSAGGKSIAVFGPAVVLHLMCLLLMICFWADLLPGNLGLTPVAIKKRSTTKKRVEQLIRLRKESSLPV